MKKYTDILRKYQDKDRIKHSISTALLMKRHAKDHGLSPESSYIAGLLHDLAKGIDDAKKVELAGRFNKRKIYRIRYLSFKKKHPELLHGAASSEILFSEYGIKDADILQAVCQHTTGGKGISKLSKYAFMADYCEPLRPYAGSKKVLKILTIDKDFDKAYFFACYFLLKKLIDKKKEICPESLEGFNEALRILISK